MGSERERRQTLGRGLRLCVNQDGQRVYGHDVNRLTVIATESYQEFADQLQKEIETDTGIPLWHRQSSTSSPPSPSPRPTARWPRWAWTSPRPCGTTCAGRHIDAKGKVQDSLKVALKDGKLACPRPSRPYRARWPSCCAGDRPRRR